MKFQFPMKFQLLVGTDQNGNLNVLVLNIFQGV